VTLTFQPQIMSLLGYPKVISIPSLNTMGSFISELCCRQTDRQMDSKILPTLTDIVMGNNDEVRNDIYNVQLMTTGFKINSKKT